MSEIERLKDEAKRLIREAANHLQHPRELLRALNDAITAIDALAAKVAGASSAEPVGLSPAQEPKYTVTGSSIVNRESGEAIPSDEPVFVFRARDVHAREALEAYACVLTPGDHRDAVVQRVADFAAFSYANPDRMKYPDTVRAAPTPSTESSAEPVAIAAPAPAEDAPDRYRVERCSALRWSVKCGDGTRDLFVGSWRGCERVARELRTAFLDGEYAASIAAQTPSDPQAASDLMTLWRAECIEALAAHPSAQPVPARQPLTEEAIQTIWRERTFLHRWGNYLDAFRDAERAHGIGTEN